MRDAAPIHYGERRGSLWELACGRTLQSPVLEVDVSRPTCRVCVRVWRRTVDS